MLNQIRAVVAHWLFDLGEWIHPDIEEEVDFMFRDEEVTLPEESEVHEVVKGYQHDERE